MQHNKKAAILAAIKNAEQSKLEEQRAYREIVKAALANEATEEMLSRIEDLGWEGVCAQMADEHWPPSGAEWQEQRGVSWDETPKHNQLQLIADEDIRHAVYFFSEVEEQLQRIKAAAKFYGLVGGGGEQVDILFAGWVQIELASTMEHVPA